MFSPIIWWWKAAFVLHPSSLGPSLANPAVLGDPRHSALTFSGCCNLLTYRQLVASWSPALGCPERRQLTAGSVWTQAPGKESRVSFLFPALRNRYFCLWSLSSVFFLSLLNSSLPISSWPLPRPFLQLHHFSALHRLAQEKEGTTSNKGTQPQKLPWEARPWIFFFFFSIYRFWTCSPIIKSSLSC